ncbi:RsmB/NOP family class I SAM-dependent RNA methyltransferase [Futiania mangrovi]|uniref:RsmB/NOP family class I SAM-dependent RNA methyltransferase n=1 Tax=Futiania mangrovi TaxID=2959716 RepID=A0A9J6P9P1_9PROT|nr:RsmB/NOP family class I SAM-dependent RNA methyltransferase [Futiania mangrovii]MCP1335621.1 RsmB/NOP family class I SAM-dependent RNA methyltransferase [Futiania mangrovii]
MRPGAHLSAAIEVLADIAGHRRPAADALRDWARTHRFAGSGDRAAIGTLVHDVLRRRASIAAHMGSDHPRALVLGALHMVWGLSPAEVARLAEDGPHAPGALGEDEMARLSAPPGPVSDPDAADVPAWCWPHFARVFGPRGVEVGAALAARAPVDLRVNTLKATREKVLKALSRFGAVETPLSPLGVRIAHPARGGRPPAVEAEAAHGKGWFEVQDEGSQLAAALTDARPGMQVLDLCAGAGGKTLALAAAMENTGQLFAYDADARRLRPIWERLKRAGVRNVQVLDAHDAEALSALEGRMDRVLVDAPCTGSGVWRRKPDAKWRMSPDALTRRMAEQDAVFDSAAPLVKPGGRLVYVTCSLFAEEGEDRVAAFRARHSAFAPVSAAGVWAAAFGTPAPEGIAEVARLDPAAHGTDGFFIAILERTA